MSLGSAFLVRMEKKVAKVARILDCTDGAFDLFDLTKRFTLDTLGEIGLAQDIGSLENPDSPFMVALDRIQDMCITRCVNYPSWKMLQWLGMADSMKADCEIRLLLECLQTYTQKAIDNLSERVNTGNDNSFLGFLFKGKELKECDSEGQTQFLNDIILRFIVAGQDTTALGISWTIFELIQHPRVLDKARAEVDRVCEQGPLKLTQLDQLPYIHATLNEGLRLHPSLPLDSRFCVQDDILPDGTNVPAGCIVHCSIYSEGRNTCLWGDDAAEFRPERWLEMEKNPSLCKNTVFNSGRRECLGKDIATVKMSTLLATVLRDFDLALEADPKSIHYLNQINLGMSRFPVMVKRRFKKF